MVIDPSLTQDAWGNFTKDVSSILYFKPTGGALPLGKFKWDIGLNLTKSIGANYGFLGGSFKYAFINNKELKYAFAARTSYSTLFGVDDFSYNQITAEILASKTYGMFSPYVGLAGLFSTANETTNKVDLNRENYFSAQGILGTQFIWKYLSLGAEIDIARINMYTIKIGTTF